MIKAVSSYSLAVYSSPCYCEPHTTIACQSHSSNPAHGPSWVGYLGATASYLSTWFFIALSTLSHLSRPLADKADKEAYRAQQTVRHNLLALWLWRYLISAVESITVPGLISVMGLILHYLPSYFLWMTAFFLGMMVTKKTREGNVSPNRPQGKEAQLAASRLDACLPIGGRMSR
jgi:hypothetical protein